MLYGKFLLRLLCVLKFLKSSKVVNVTFFFISLRFMYICIRSCNHCDRTVHAVLLCYVIVPFTVPEAEDSHHLVPEFGASENVDVEIKGAVAVHQDVADAPTKF